MTFLLPLKMSRSIVNPGVILRFRVFWFQNKNGALRFQNENGALRFQNETDGALLLINKRSPKVVKKFMLNSAEQEI